MSFKRQAKRSYVNIVHYFHFDRPSSPTAKKPQTCINNSKQTRVKHNRVKRSKAMASAILKRTSPSCLLKSMADSLGIIGGSWRSYAKVAVGTDIVSAAPGVSLQKSRTWDEGVSSKFSTTPLKDIFKVG